MQSFTQTQVLDEQQPYEPSLKIYLVKLINLLPKLAILCPGRVQVLLKKYGKRARFAPAAVKETLRDDEISRSHAFFVEITPGVRQH
jgi:hypothetical protein